ncbi:GalNAc-alpha-(1-_4)-GalNAc-alpha-(1-_3)-diNAcBac-PP-undecaprenol alpha-1,4-N-acetyl-D-galactosaminyltransferase [Lacunisphaera limnophila]|uniref:GalNAc-alpha-(1->4)-GalNAc-alpha-(1->3)-diNAcBac-PP-undecaprenol alpha-1,4-N-acetyl-D-galactosaminyltransferase n=1 Tax=Lacunisphaera limnophila TaxID=1838286 RepID=A0A1D8AXZ6_9BACT|nr:glycosyltransferase [Lacunisphaera limnophila]AOS45744.1 GalNAc-alpha-(1->4)-GalNAc-alpha-(1->3)-diNAcBac-PP-undecaprenol alpha-1,4-N-acetyl-D-galactosaminyltransferase [Lacunisphaera limnophila]
MNPASFPPRTTGRILSLVARHVGGVAVFWENMRRQFPEVDVVYFAEGERTYFDAATRTLHYCVYDPLTHVYRTLAAHIQVDQYDTLVANERFELEFFLWTGTARPVLFIVHTNHEHSYSLAFRHAGRVDHFFCVSETAAAYLRARGISRISAFQYSTFVDVAPLPTKENRVLYVGRLEPDKNILETIELFRLFRQQGYTVRMIGVGSLADDVRAALAPDEVRIGIPRAAVLQEMAAARFLCLNSYVEGLPITYAEAMHFRLGVICNYVDKTSAQVLGANYLLHSTPADLLARMETFTFSEPPAPRRINHPELNEAFLRQLKAVPRAAGPRPAFAPGSWLDHTSLLPAALIRSVRAWRMQRLTRS